MRLDRVLDGIGGSRGLCPRVERFALSAMRCLAPGLALFLALIACGCTDVASSQRPVAEAPRALRETTAESATRDAPTPGQTAPPAGWTAKTRRVRVATPEGEVTREIVYHTNSLGMPFVKIPAGDFMMGSPASEEGRASDEEGPVHRVRISEPFYMGACEVTNDQYRQFKRDHDSGDYLGKGLNGGDQPVAKVSWNDAKAFCEWLSRKEGVKYRMPTEAEWEYACRAGSRTRFHNGDSDSALGAIAWHSSNSGGKTHPVGGKASNAFGLFDMHGNVWEWCQDWFDSKYYANSPEMDPKGPDSGKGRVLRGGSWLNLPRHCRSAYRAYDNPANPYSYYGFRVVVSSPEE